MVLAAPDFIAERGLRDVAWLRGMGWATEPSFLGDRDLRQRAGTRGRGASRPMTQPASPIRRRLSISPR